MKREVQREYEDYGSSSRESVIFFNQSFTGYDSGAVEEVMAEISDSDDSTMEEPVPKKACRENSESVEPQTFDDLSGDIRFELIPVIIYILLLFYHYCI